MSKAILFNFLVNKEESKINVERSFNAPIDKVWTAWTDAEILDQWWAPKPWRAETKSMDFRPGGIWHYCMVSPDGKERHWCIAEYKTVVTGESYSYIDAFCDENAKPNDSKPRVNWINDFKQDGDATNVSIELSFDNFADLEALIAMGFKEGFTMGMENLDQYLATQKA